MHDVRPVLLPAAVALPRLPEERPYRRPQVQRRRNGRHLHGHPVGKRPVRTHHPLRPRGRRARRGAEAHDPDRLLARRGKDRHAGEERLPPGGGGRRERYHPLRYEVRAGGVITTGGSRAKTGSRSIPVYPGPPAIPLFLYRIPRAISPASMSGPAARRHSLR